MVHAVCLNHQEIFMEDLRSNKKTWYEIWKQNVSTGTNTFNMPRVMFVHALHQKDLI